MNEELMLKKQVEKVLKNAEEILYKIDSEIDKMEGKNIHAAMMKVQDYLLDWNLLAHNFANQGIYDWVEPEEQDAQQQNQPK